MTPDSRPDLLLIDGRGTIDRTAVDHGLKQTVVEVIGMRIDGTGALALIAELCEYLRIQEISARDDFSEDTKALGVIGRQFSHELRRETPLGRTKQFSQSGGRCDVDG